MRALASQGEVLDVPAGELIFRSGETGDCMFGVLEGSVELSWNEEGGQEIIQAGDVFGAGALVTSEHRRYGSATALSDCKVLVMNREKFLFPREIPLRRSGIADVRHRAARLDRQAPAATQGLHQIQLSRQRANGAGTAGV